MRSPKFPEYNEQQLAEWCVILYEKGRSLRWIAEKLELSYSAVRRMLVAEKVIFRQKEEVTLAGRRTCNTCHRDKPLSHFPKDPTKSKGVGYRCKRCKREGKR